MLHEQHTHCSLMRWALTFVGVAGFLPCFDCAFPVSTPAESTQFAAGTGSCGAENGGACANALTEEEAEDEIAAAAFSGMLQKSHGLVPREAPSDPRGTQASAREQPQGEQGTKLLEEAAEEEVLAVEALAGLLQKSHALVPREASSDPQGMQALAREQPQGERGTKLLEAVLPVAWIHFPKAGTSFVNSLFSLPGVCPGRDVVYAGNDFLCTPTTFLSTIHNGSDCPGIYELAHHWCHQSYLGSASMYEAHYLGHMVGMFRQPEQFLLSGWKDRAYQVELDVYGEDTHILLPVGTFARFNQGTMVNMLLGKPTVDTDSDPQVLGLLHFVPAAGDVARAVERVRGFAFVGLTEQWDLSICLVHKMFGGSCTSAEFVNTRPGAQSSNSSLYDTSILQGFTDEYDGPVYAEATRIFRKNVQFFDVSFESCGTCFAQASGA